MSSPMVFDVVLLAEVVTRSSLVLLGTLVLLLVLRKGRARRRSVVLSVAFILLLGILGLAVFGAEGMWRGLRVELPLAAAETNETLPSTASPDALPGSSEPLTSTLRSGEEDKPVAGPAGLEDPDPEKSPSQDGDRATPAADLSGPAEGGFAGIAVPRLVRASAPLVLTLVWLIGALALLLRLLIGLVRMNRLVVRSEPASKEVLEVLEKLTAADAKSSAPLLLVSDEIAVPMTSGLGSGVLRCFRANGGLPIRMPRWEIAGLTKSVVLLPRGAQRWSEQRLTIVLLHELGHISRGDWGVRLMTRMVRCCYWWQPLATWACQRLELEQELACDEWVARRVRPSDYARHLLQLHHDLSAKPGATMAMALPIVSKPQLERRMMNLLDPLLLRRSAGTPALLAALCFMLLVAAVQPEVVRRTILPLELSPGEEVVVPAVPATSGGSVGAGAPTVPPQPVLPEDLVRTPVQRVAPTPAVAPVPFEPSRLQRVPESAAYPHALNPSPRSVYPVVAAAVPIGVGEPSWVGSPPSNLAQIRETSPQEDEGVMARDRLIAELQARIEVLSKEVAERRLQTRELGEAQRRQAEMVQARLAEEMARRQELAAARQVAVSASNERRIVATQRALAKAEKQAAEQRAALAEGEQEAARAEVRAERDRRLRAEELRELGAVSRRLERDRLLAKERAVREQVRSKQESALAELRRAPRADRETPERLKELEEMERLRRFPRFPRSARPSSVPGVPSAPGAPGAPDVSGAIAGPRGPRATFPPLAPRPDDLLREGFDSQLGSAIQGVIRQEAQPLGLDEDAVLSAAEAVMEVLGTRHRMQTNDSGVAFDRVVVVGSPSEVRAQLSMAWTRAIEEGAETDRDAAIRAAIRRLAYEILEVEP